VKYISVPKSLDPTVQGGSLKRALFQKCIV
jgi:hypothetical protein